MLTPRNHHRLLVFAAVAILAFAMWLVRDAARWYGRPIGGILVDPDGLVSNFGLPTWDGFEQGLRYPDKILTVDGHELSVSAPLDHRAKVWDRAVDAAATATPPRTSVHVRVLGAQDQRERELDLRIGPLDPVAFWLLGAATIAIALLYVAGAIVALWASQHGRLARTFAKTTLFAALFLFTLFDYHTTRRFVPLFHLAFAMVPMGFFALALRLPNDVPALQRRPWIVGALDGLGGVLALSMIAAHLSGRTTGTLRDLCTALIGASFFFFVVTFLVRFWRARGDRRATMRALLSMVPAYIVIGIGFLLASLRLQGVPTALLAVPVLALTPLSSVYALIRHDLWGSRVLLSRVLMRMIIVAVTCSLAIALGALVAVLFDAPWRAALLAATVAGAAGLMIEPALRFGDRALFPSRGAYKPTIAQLTEELTAITKPEDVGNAVESTVRRLLDCEKVEFRRAPDDERGSNEVESISGIRQLQGATAASSRPPPAPAASPAGAPPGLSDERAIDVLFNDRRLAVLYVGQKRHNELFNTEDMDLLQSIANLAALALARYAYAELELRRQQEAAAWRGERAALVETVAAEIAHEVQCPINFFHSIFQRGHDELRLDAEDVDLGAAEVERLKRLLSGLRGVAPLHLERQPVAVEDLVDKAERLLRDKLGARSVEASQCGGAAVRCDSDQATQILVNLLSNALDAAGRDGRVGVDWTPGSDPASPRGGALTVWDTGPGFVGDPARVFAPWYTTKPRGTGLGLAITHRIVRAHGWTIEPARRDGRTLFVIEIPASDIVANHGDRGMEVA